MRGFTISQQPRIESKEGICAGRHVAVVTGAVACALLFDLTRTLGEFRSEKDSARQVCLETVTVGAMTQNRHLLVLRLFVCYSECLLFCLENLCALLSD